MHAEATGSSARPPPWRAGSACSGCRTQEPPQGGRRRHSAVPLAGVPAGAAEPPGSELARERMPARRRWFAARLPWPRPAPVRRGQVMSGASFGVHATAMRARQAIPHRPKPHIMWCPHAGERGNKQHSGDGLPLRVMTPSLETDHALTLARTLDQHAKCTSVGSANSSRCRARDRTTVENRRSSAGIAMSRSVFHSRTPSVNSMTRWLRAA